MQSPTRRWLAAIAILILAAFGALIAYRLIDGQEVTTPELTAYLPKREAALVYMDVESIRDSGIMEKVIGTAVAEESEYKAFVERSGFNYKTDLDDLMMSSVAGTHFAILQGRFDWPKLQSYAKGEGGACDGQYCWVPGSTPGKILSFRSLGKKLLAFASGNNKDLARQIEKRQVQNAFTIPKEPIWMFVPASIVRGERDVPSGMKLFLRAVEVSESLLFTVGVKQEAFELVANVSCRSEEDAATLRAQLEGLTTLLQKLIARQDQAPSAADLSGVLTSGKFERDARHVLGRWTIQKVFLESLGKT